MITRKDTCAVAFFIDGKQYAYRSWPYVPRVGEEVMLHVPEEGDKRTFLVTRVVWGVEGPDGHDLGQQAVNIEIERIK